MSDNLLTLADSLVTALAGAFPTFAFAGKTLPVRVEWSEDINVELADESIRTPLVWVLDAGEKTQSEHGLGMEDYQLLIIVQMKIPAACDTAAFARAMSGLAASIRTWCRGRDECAALALGEDEEVPCLSADRPMARNHDEWHHRRRFFSEILTTWRRA